MTMGRKQDRPGRRALRRGAALLMAGATLWVIAFTSDTAAALRAIQALGESQAFVTGLLEAELGTDDSPAGALNAWQRAVVNQSALLAAGADGVEAVQTEEAQTPEETAPAEEVEPEPEAEEETAAETTAPDDIVDTNLTTSSGANSVSAANIHINNTTSKTLDIGALLNHPLSLDLGEGPQILIMHTHGSEAYTMDGTDIYEPSDTARTTDPEYNMIRIGEEMKEVFEELGLGVVHDTELYDYPGYSGSYDRSKAGVEAYLAQYPTIRVVLDVHRDALIAEDGTTYKVTSQVDGETAAQVMMVIGTDDTGLNHPNWTENLSFAVQLQGALNQDYPTLARPITLRTSRFNQQLSLGSILVEVGTNGNTLQEAILGARLFARTAGEFLLEQMK